MKLPLLNFILSILLSLNIFFFHSPLLGIIFGLSFIILSSYLLGQIFFGRRHPGMSPSGKTKWLPDIMPREQQRTFFGFLTFLSVTIIILTIIYYFYQLNNFIIAGFLILLSLTIVILSLVLFKKGRGEGSLGFNKITVKRFLPPAFWQRRKIKMTSRTFLLVFFVYLFFLILSYFILRSAQTLEAVRTPWHFVSKWFFLVYFLATLTLIYLATRLKAVYSLILASLHLFFTFSVANIIFPLGFGYDPFIHRATEKYILEHGFILPKPFYYLGQYSLVVFLTKLFNISSVIIDRYLVPSLSAILIPSTIYYTFKKLLITRLPRSFGHELKAEWAKSRGYSLLVTFLFLFIPFPIFTFTTPQNLADLFVIIIAFLSLNFILNNNRLQVTGYGLLILMTLTILMIHPLAGLAVLIFIIILFVNKLKQKNKFTLLLYYFITLLLCLSIFSVFLLFSLNSPFKVEVVNNFNLVNFYHNLFRFSPHLFLNTNFVHLIKTTAYFLWQPIVVFIIIFSSALPGLLLLKRQEYKNIKIQEYKNTETNPFVTLLLPSTREYFITFIILFINSLLIFSFLNFPFLIDYERGDFSWRIFNLGVWFLVPLALTAITGLFNKARAILSLLDRWVYKKKSFWIPAFAGMTISIFLSLGLTTSLYFSYPRHDIYAMNKGFNTSLHDFNAVQYLEENTPEPYVVLANQQVGAAALTSFSFRYFDHKYFFYSIPTGSELYQIFARMAYDQEISYETVKKAMELTGVRVVYFYLNDYWFNFKKIKPLLEQAADGVVKLEDGKVWVFKFVRK